MLTDEHFYRTDELEAGRLREREGTTLIVHIVCIFALRSGYVKFFHYFYV